MHGLDLSGSGVGQVTDTCKCCNGSSGSIKYGEYLEKLAENRLASQEGLYSVE